MIRRRIIPLLATVAVVSVFVLIAVLHSQQKSMQRRWAMQVAPRPAQGAELFAAKCGQCHQRGASLREAASARSLPILASALWNHAPQMWDMLQARKLPYPSLSYEETAQLTAYLYLSSAMDAPGDPARGRELFVHMRCVECHSESAARLRSACSTPLDCTQSLWNHAGAMRARMHEVSVVWPRFTADDLRDLYAYFNEGGSAAHAAMIGDPDTGWRVFQQKGCIRCHAVQSEGSGVGPALRSEPESGATLSEFGASLLNHLPQMQAVTAENGHHWPTFDEHELTSLAVFLYSLKYSQPAGSPAVGKSVFAWRGCARCHGEDAQGGSAPSLRGRGSTYTAERLATDFWRHGSGMYAQTRRSGQPWPVLQPPDVGHLLSFLNTPLD